MIPASIISLANSRPSTASKQSVVVKNVAISGSCHLRERFAGWHKDKKATGAEPTGFGPFYIWFLAISGLLGLNPKFDYRFVALRLAARGFFSPSLPAERPVAGFVGSA